MIIIYLGAGMFCTALILYVAATLATYISICKGVPPASKKFYFLNILEQLAQVEIIIMVCGCLIMVGGIFYVLLTDPMTLIKK